MKTPCAPFRILGLPLLVSVLGAQQATDVAPVLDDATAEAIRREGMENSRVMEYLKELTDLSRSGGRLTGSDNYTRACYWALEQFLEMGLDARLEPWGEWRHSWNRGAWHGRVVSPVPLELFVATQAWTAGTPGTVRGPLLPMPESGQALTELGERAKGAFLFGALPRGGAAGEMRAAAEASGVAGIVHAAAGSEAFPNRIRVFGSHAVAQREPEALPTVPEIAVRADHGARLAELLEAEEPVVVEFNIENSFRQGPVVLYNVVGEIRGSEIPEEVVVVCGHLDSWHQATGTTDNGTGVTSAMEAARILASVGAEPKRTIRFILWGGEEQGLLGSRQYVRQHREELPRISAVFNHDTGTNWAHSMRVTTSQLGDMQRVFAAVQRMQAPDPGAEQVFDLGAVESIGGGRGGSDHASFLAQGVPAFSWGLTGRADYFNYSWHTQWDTYDAAIPEYQRHTSVVIALAALGTSNLPGLLDREGIDAGGGRGRGAPRGRGGAAGAQGFLSAAFGAVVDGLRFTRIDPDGVAARAGIRDGDVLRSINGQPIRDLASILTILVERPAELRLVLQRGDDEVEVTVDPASLGRRGRRGGP